MTVLEDKVREDEPNVVVMVMEGGVNNKVPYVVTWYRWVMLALFVLYSASNSMTWTQYTIISNIVVKYYGVPSTLVSWTSMVYMVTYVPLIFPASWFLDKVCDWKMTPPLPWHAARHASEGFSQKKRNRRFVLFK